MRTQQQRPCVVSCRAQTQTPRGWITNTSLVRSRLLRLVLVVQLLNHSPLPSLRLLRIDPLNLGSPSQWVKVFTLLSSISRSFVWFLGFFRVPVCSLFDSNLLSSVAADGFVTPRKIPRKRPFHEDHLVAQDVRPPSMRMQVFVRWYSTHHPRIHSHRNSVRSRLHSGALSSIMISFTVLGIMTLTIINPSRGNLEPSLIAGNHISTRCSHRALLVRRLGTSPFAAIGTAPALC